MSDLRRAAALIEEDPDEARAICEDILREEPENVLALFLLGNIYAKAERFGSALPIFERCTRLAPRRDEVWNNLGMTLQECGQNAESREAFKRALELNQKPSYMANLAVGYLQDGNHVEAKRWARKAIEREPEHSGAWTTLGFASLATGDWETGWKGYTYALGGKFRKEVKLGDEPRWDGSPVDSLFLYGEQGLGDEIMYASCLPDAIQRAGKVTLECDQRLEGLYRRSFPTADVHGTRRSERTWAEGRHFDAGAPVGDLPRHFRPSPASCPRVPYLVADPQRRLQWRALFDSWGRKPVIGLAWSGGRANTQRKARAVGLEALRPLIEGTDAHFVSLQYTDARAEIEATGLPVQHLQRAVQSPDYDDTAAFVAECDLIVGVHTTVHHLAGALGVPSVVLIPSKPSWNYAHGDRLPWYGHQVFHRQRKDETWADCVKRLDIGQHWKAAA